MTWPRASAAIAFTLVIFVLLFGPVAFRALEPESPASAADFPNYYFGGERLMDGRPVYDDLATEVEAQFGLVGYDTYPADPPPTVVLFAPFSLLSYEAAWRLWQALSAILIFYSLNLVAREVGYPPPAAAVIASVAFLTTPVRFLLERNHMESLLLILGVLGWRAIRRGNESRGAGLWGLATGLKLFPGMWLVGLIDGRRRRAAVQGGTVAIGMLAVAGIVVGADNVAQYVSETIPAARQWYGTLGNYSLFSVGTGLVARWFGWMLVLAGALTLLPRYLTRPSGPDRSFVLGTTLALLLSPLAWLNYLVLAIPAVIILSCHLDLATNARHRIGGSALVVALFGWGPITIGSELLSELGSFVPTYALVALFVIADRSMKEMSWS